MRYTKGLGIKNISVKLGIKELLKVYYITVKVIFISLNQKIKRKKQQ